MDDAAAPPVARLYELVRRARLARSERELAFLLVNDSLQLLPYRQSALWRADSGVDSLSGVVQPEANAPYVQWLARLCRHLAAQPPADGRLTAPALPAALAAEWADWWPAHALVLPMGRDGEPAQALLLLLDEAAWTADDVALAREWTQAWWHAFTALRRSSAGRLRGWRARLGGAPAPDGAPQPRWWQRRGPRWLAGALLVAAFPVRLTVLAPGELVPAHPVVVRAPLDGVIGSFHVQPNALVREGQPLFGFDEMLIQGRLDVARQALATAETEYRQSSQQALLDARVKAQLALLTGKIDEKRTEVRLPRRTAAARPRAGTAGRRGAVRRPQRVDRPARHGGRAHPAHRRARRRRDRGLAAAGRHAGAADRCRREALPERHAAGPGGRAAALPGA